MSADPDTLRHQLQRLIEDAPLIAPSIGLFDTHGNYGQVDDRELNRQRVITFELEAEALLQRLEQDPDPVFARLLDKYRALEEEAKGIPGRQRGFHSRSTWVHKAQQLLQSALELLERRSASAGGSAPPPPEEALARPLLKLLSPGGLASPARPRLD